MNTLGRTHMRTSMGALVLGCGLVVGLGAAHAGDDARAVIDKAIKAMGGEEKLKKFQAVTWSEKGIYYGGGGEDAYTGKYAVQWPGQFRMEIEGVFTIVLDNDKGWVSFGGMTQALAGDKLKGNIDAQRARWITTLAPLTDKAFTLSAFAS